MSAKTRKARAEKEVQDAESWTALNDRLVKLTRICRWLKAREGRLAVGMVALQVAYKKQDALAINKFMGELLRGDLAEAIQVITDRDLAMKTALDALRDLGEIDNDHGDACGCVKCAGDGSDWRKAKKALDAIKTLDPYFFYTHDGQPLEQKPEMAAPSAAPAPAGQA